MQNGMKTRNILYGYCYQNGKIIHRLEERTVVEEMCQAYLDGQSLLEIAESLNRRGIEYMPGITGWNKSRIMRLLEDKRYLGTEQYPAIMAQETYDSIQEIRNIKNTQKEVDRQAEFFQIAVPVRCPQCGELLKRKLDKRSIISRRWICSNENCNMAIGKEDALFIGEITRLMNEVIEHPDKVAIPTEQEIEPSEDLRRLKGEVVRILNAPKIDREKAREKMLEYASKRYEEMDCTPCQARKLRDVFIGAEPSRGFNVDLFYQTVDEIKLYRDGTVGLILENKQEIRNGGRYGTS